MYSQLRGENISEGITYHHNNYTYNYLLFQVSKRFTKTAKMTHNSILLAVLTQETIHEINKLKCISSQM